jgi:thioredoxin-like negative regulator of GroEL
VHDGGDDPAWWQFRVPAIPAAYLLNGEGEIVAQWNGKVEFADVRAQVERLLTPSP